MKTLALFVMTILFLANFCHAEEEVVFTGTPEMRISEGGVSRTPESLAKNEAKEYQCIITKIDDEYYWTTRENVELVPIVGGAFTTFIAANGSGYVRVLNPEFKELIPSMSETEQNYDYIEHLILGLRTISYYGKSK